jgi:hypothetical protein
MITRFAHCKIGTKRDVAGSSRPTDPVQLGEEVCETGGQAGAALNVPSAGRQEGVVVTVGIGPKQCCRKIIVASRQMTLYLLHRCTFTLRLRDNF